MSCAAQHPVIVDASDHARPLIDYGKLGARNERRDINDLPTVLIGFLGVESKQSR